MHSGGVASGLGLGSPTVPKTLGHEAALELGEHPLHLAQGRPHRVVGVIAVNLTVVSGEDRGASVPADGEDGLLCGEGTSPDDRGEVPIPPEPAATF